MLTLFLLLLLVAGSEWLGQKKYFHYLGAVLLVIIGGAILSNLTLLPGSRETVPVYDFIFTYAAPLGIFYLLLDVRVKELKAAGLPMIALFLFGSFCTMIGVVMSFWLLHPDRHGIHSAFAVAGMYTGTYIGGSANLNAVGLHYGVNKDGTLFAAINAADNIISTIWIMVTIFLPRLLQRWWPRVKREAPPVTSPETINTDTVRDSISILSLGVLLSLGVGSLYVSQLLHDRWPRIPSILVLTTLALVLAQFSFVHRLKGSRTLGYFLVLLFLAVIGAYCDLGALLSSGEVALTLMAWVTAIVFLHGILLFGIGGLVKQDWDMISIASNANIGGATSAGVLAITLGRNNLQLPGILVGSLGNAIGTYLGLIIAEMLK